LGEAKEGKKENGEHLDGSASAQQQQQQQPRQQQITQITHVENASLLCIPGLLGKIVVL
jgi:hypothetical protein